MPSTALGRQRLAGICVAMLLVGGCSRKPETGSSSSPNTNVVATPVPPPPPPGPGPHATAQDYDTYGVSLGKKEKYDEAIAAFDSALRLDPQFAPAYFDRGYARMLQGKNDSAALDFNHAIEIVPNYRDAYYQLGLLMGMQGDFDKAVDDFQRALRIDPNYAPAYFGIGHSYYFQGNLDGAVAQIERALSLDPTLKYCYYIRGLIRHAQGNRADARTDFQTLVDSKVHVGAFWLYICDGEDSNRGLARQDVSDALNDPLVFPPDSPATDLANLLLERTSQTELIAKATAAKDPTILCQVWFYAGEAARLNGDHKGAKDCFTKAIATDAKGAEEFVEAKRELDGLNSQ